MIRNLSKIKFYLFLAFLFFFSSSFVFAQNYLNLEFIRKIPFKSEKIYVDDLQNIYELGENAIKKYDKNGKQKASFSSPLSEEITSLDVSNFLKLMIFFDAENKITFLDQNLNEINTFYLDEYNIFSAKLVCNSVKNGFYAYDNFEKSVIFIPNSQNENLEKTKINFIAKNFEPNFILENNQKIFLNYPDTGIFVLNQYLFKENFIPIKNCENFEINGDKITYFEPKKSVLKVYDLKKNEINEINLPQENSENAFFKKNYLYLKKEAHLYIYELK